MSVLHRYIGLEIYRATLLVCGVLLALFTFFAIIDQLDGVGRGVYSLRYMALIQLLSLPTRLYDFLPIATLIGGILALSALAQRSEITVMRASGLGVKRMLGVLAIVSIPLMLLAVGLGEGLAPRAELKLAEAQLNLGTAGRQSNLLRSGYWFRENLEPNGGTRFINIASLGLDGDAQSLTFYELDADSHLQRIVQAKTGHFDRQAGSSALQLNNVTEHVFNLPAQLPDPATALQTPMSRVIQYTETRSATSLTAALLISRVLTPERMSMPTLMRYLTYLGKTGQNRQRHETALWRKGVYPLTLLVMLCIAAPLGWILPRQGAVGIKIFIGVLIGVGYYMLNQLALSVGLIYGVGPWWTALGPPILMLSLALGSLVWLERRIRWRQ